MIEINRKVLGKFYLYTPEEADKLGISHDAHWSEVEEGNWTLTDDDLVVQCLKASDMNKGKINSYRRRVLKFPFGYVWITFKKDGSLFNKELKAMPYIKARAFNRMAPITFGAKIAKAKRWKRFFEVYATMVVENRATKENIMKLAYRFCKHHTQPELALKVVLRQKEVKQKMEEMVIKKMAEQGIEDPKGYAVKLLKKAAEIAEKDRNPDAMIKVAKEFNVLLDAYPKKTTVTDQIEMVNTKMLADTMAKEEEKLKLSRSTTE